MTLKPAADCLATAAAMAGNQDYPAACLFMVATPIGNRADISLRALHVLQLADVLACEDTRHSMALLQGYGINKPGSSWLALHQHNERAATEQVLVHLQAGRRVACLSDAGSPGISDPGARLAGACHAAGLRVMPLPGPSSPTALISAAGLAGDGRFLFDGFLPTKASERDLRIQHWQTLDLAVVWLEAPHRILATAQALRVLADRPVTVGRELTKQFEQVVTCPAQGLHAWLSLKEQHQRGEFVLVLHPPPAAPACDVVDERMLRLLLDELPLSAAVRLASRLGAGPRKALYARALILAPEAAGTAGEPED